MSDKKEVEEKFASNEEEANVDPEAELEEVIKEKLKEQYDHGIRVGIMSLSKLVNDKLSDSSLPLMKRIAEVRKLCKIAPGIEKKYNEVASTATDAVENATTIDGADLSDGQSAN